MLEIEKKRAEVIEKTMAVDINLETGQSKMKHNEEEEEFSYARQNEDVNQFLQAQVGKSDALYKPFESCEGFEGVQTCEDLERQFANLSAFTFKAADLSEDKQKKVYEKLRPEPAQQKVLPKKGKRGKGKLDSEFPDMEEAKANEDGSAQKDQLFSHL